MKGHGISVGTRATEAQTLSASLTCPRQSDHQNKLLTLERAGGAPSGAPPLPVTLGRAMLRVGMDGPPVGYEYGPGEEYPPGARSVLVGAGAPEPLAVPVYADPGKAGMPDTAPEGKGKDSPADSEGKAMDLPSEGKGNLDSPSEGNGNDSPLEGNGTDMPLEGNGKDMPLEGNGTDSPEGKGTDLSEGKGTDTPEGKGMSRPPPDGSDLGNALPLGKGGKDIEGKPEGKENDPEGMGKDWEGKPPLALGKGAKVLRAVGPGRVGVGGEDVDDSSRPTTLTGLALTGSRGLVI